MLQSVPLKENYTETEKAQLLFATETAGKYKIASKDAELNNLLNKSGSDEDIRSSAARALMLIDPSQIRRLLLKK
jgi:hypothetical protein